MTEDVFWVIAMCVICSVGGCGVGASMMSDRYQAEAIERGFAEYDGKTGYWAWKEPEAQ